MAQLLLATLILGLSVYGLKFFARASPRVVARTVRYAGGGIVAAVSLSLLLRGRVDLAVAGLGFALWLAGFVRVPSWNPFAAATPSASDRSRVRSATIEMELDHASGAMRGTIAAGADSGRPLETLARPECETLYRTCLRDDPDGARLLEAYMDRRFPGWRETSQADRDAGTHGAGRRNAGLSEQQAYEILGLGEGATRDDIVRAHRALMKKFHPDHGGTTDFAARVNEAKEILLRRVR